MGEGARRNQPCWCGSGKKLKHCHLDRERQTPLQLWEAGREMRRAFSRNLCSAPDGWADECSGKIVKAHTVPKTGSLARIARDGHVYAFVPSMENFEKNRGLLIPELVGINRASTFTGFCSFHDDRIFSPIEKFEFSATPEQCFLLGYRAVARELYTKQSSVNLAEFRRGADRGRSPTAQVAIQRLNQAFDFGNEAGLKDIKYHKERYDAVLRSGEYSDVRAYVLEFEGPPSVMCSASWMPSEDFEGGQLQDLLDLERTPHEMTFTSFWGGTRGYVVFQWLKEDGGTCDRFIDSFRSLPKEDITTGLLRLMFEYFENVHIQPDWWDGLGEASKKLLIDRMGLSINPFAKRKQNVLFKDGLDVAGWVLIGDKTVGY